MVHPSRIIVSASAASATNEPAFSPQVDAALALVVVLVLALWGVMWLASVSTRGSAFDSWSERHPGIALLVGGPWIWLISIGVVMSAYIKGRCKK